MIEQNSQSDLHDEIVKIIPEESSVLDLGCGNGDLLSRLIVEKSARGEGVEIDDEATVQCLRKGLSVYHGDLDEGLKIYGDQSFDYVILSETLQVLRYPLNMLHEMARVGRKAIVTLPNFGYWQPRFELLFRGKMPMNRYLPHTWYETPNIHLCTISDFKELCTQESFVICYIKYRGGFLKNVSPNLFAQSALFVISK